MKRNFASSQFQCHFHITTVMLHFNTFISCKDTYRSSNDFHMDEIVFCFCVCRFLPLALHLPSFSCFALASPLPSLSSLYCLHFSQFYHFTHFPYFSRYTFLTLLILLTILPSGGWRPPPLFSPSSTKHDDAIQAINTWLIRVEQKLARFENWNDRRNR